MPVNGSYDVIIVGGGPAGLNAAVVLGRCRRKIIVFDSGNQRNKQSHGIHNFLTRDDILPSAFLRIAEKEIKKYGASLKRKKIISASKIANGNFIVKDWEGVAYQSRKLIIATGLTDILPAIKGIENFYGKSVFHCPYCDGWEVRDKRIAVYSETKKGVELALSLKTWSRHVSFFTTASTNLTPNDKLLLKQYDIPVIRDKIVQLEGKNGQLQYLILKGKKSYPCDALFFVTGYHQHSGLARELGCQLSKQNVVITNKSGRTTIPGLYVVGDSSWDMHLVIIAAAEGAKAGVYINKQLQKEEKQHLLASRKILT
jgi:thioredoxin reductase